MLCGFDFGKLSILDRDTHAVLWQANAEPAIWTTSGLLAGDGALRLVDPRTGRSLLDAAGWQRVHHRRRFPDDHGHAVLIRPVDHRTYIGHLTPQGIRVLGSVPRPLSECQSDQDLLICVAPGIGAEVWRLDLRG